MALWVWKRKGRREWERQREGGRRGERRWKMTQRSTCHSGWCHPRRELTALASWGAPVLREDRGRQGPRSLLGELSSSTRSHHTAPRRPQRALQPLHPINQAQTWDGRRAMVICPVLVYIHVHFLSGEIIISVTGGREEGKRCLLLQSGIVTHHYVNPVTVWCNPIQIG